MMHFSRVHKAKIGGKEISYWNTKNDTRVTEKNEIGVVIIGIAALNMFRNAAELGLNPLMHWKRRLRDWMVITEKIGRPCSVRKISETCNYLKHSAAENFGCFSWRPCYCGWGMGAGAGACAGFGGGACWTGDGGGIVTCGGGGDDLWRRHLDLSSSAERAANLSDWVL